MAAKMAVSMPMRYIKKTMLAAFSGKNIMAKSDIMGSLAPQVKNGVTKMEISRSFSESRARAPMMAGTPQPKPIISGMMPLPVSPQRRMTGSVMKATRAI